MKITIIGGAGIRVPLLVHGLAQSDLPIDEIFVCDRGDVPKQIGMLQLAGAMSKNVPVVLDVNPHSAMTGASFVITSIRVGGAAQRARDEAAALALDVVGQETVGPVGFAMAMRTIPAMLEYGEWAAEAAPDAWMINFSNPVSIITQAVHQHTPAKLIGICDTPMEMFEDAAHALGLPATACSYDYFGLNHLGWLREVWFEGQGQLRRIWDDDAKLRAAYRSPLFEAERLRALKLLPTEYLYYYYRPEVALAHMKKAGSSRGQQVAALTEAFLQGVRKSNREEIDAVDLDDLVSRYQQYLAARDGSYMTIETGNAEPRVKPDWAELSGYDRIAVMAIRSIVHDLGAIIPLDVANNGTLPFLEDDDIVEVPCRVGKNGPQPQQVAPIPQHPRELIEKVKAYERATVKAALSGDRDEAVEALALNPLVPSRDKAAQLVEALL